MKTIVFSLLAATVMLTSCEKDNFAEPTSMLKGRVIYENQPVGVRTNGVQLELWQPGYQLFTKIPVQIAQDGSFSASLFNGNYKLVRLRGNGPWVDNTDTINVSVQGAATIDVPVQPYFVIKNEKMQKSGTNLTASCLVSQATTGRAIERVTFYVSTTQYVDINNNVAKVDKTGSDLTDLTKEMAFSLAVPASVTSKGYCYGRVGVKTVGVAEMLYTPVQKITL
ncbi:DUF3823 domain-containing protein [Spirosoma validum]|uniref:DUF3823 domain-containing protein n=1 Tax=Spirosoma validum TaxID=2771355 RepID=A0A927B539_9BACT|nr:DUF3823 domain-containing protein [Spirosoma validum]MBD2755463.1 DUF3823 domain-containing protein [Spirosoma validum]